MTDDPLRDLNQCGLELKGLAIYKEIADSRNFGTNEVAPNVWTDWQ